MFDNTKGRHLANLRTGLSAVSLSLMLLASPLQAQGGAPETSPALRSAIAKEEIERDLRGALAGYRAIAADATAAEGLRRQAELRAALVLQRLGNAAEYKSTLQRLATGVDPVATRAKELLARPDEDSERWLELKARARDLASRYENTKGQLQSDLIWIGAPAIDAIRELGLDQNTYLNVHGFRALWLIDDPRAAQVILDLADSSDPVLGAIFLAARHAKAQGNGGPLHQDALEKLLDRMGLDHPETINCISTGTLEPKRMVKYLRSDNRKVRIAALTGLTSYSHRQYENPDIVPLVLEAFDAPDPEVHRRAEGILRDMWWYTRATRLKVLQHVEDWTRWTWVPSPEFVTIEDGEADELAEALGNAVRADWIRYPTDDLEERFAAIVSAMMDLIESKTSAARLQDIVDIRCAQRSEKVRAFLDRHADELDVATIVAAADNSIVRDEASTQILFWLMRREQKESNWAAVKRLSDAKVQDYFLHVAARTGHADVAPLLIERIEKEKDRGKSYARSMAILYHWNRKDELSRGVLRAVLRNPGPIRTIQVSGGVSSNGQAYRTEPYPQASSAPSSSALRLLAESGAEDLAELLDIENLPYRIDVSQLQRIPDVEELDVTPLPFDDAEYFGLWDQLIQGPLKSHPKILIDLWLGDWENTITPEPILESLIASRTRTSVGALEPALLRYAYLGIATPTQIEQIQALQLDLLRDAHPIDRERMLKRLPKRLNDEFIEALKAMAPTSNDAFDALQRRGVPASRALLDQVFAPEQRSLYGALADLRNVPGQPTLDVLEMVTKRLFAEEIRETGDFPGLIQALGRTLEPRAAVLLLRIADEVPEVSDQARKELEKIRFHREQKAHWDKVLSGTPELGGSRAASKLVTQARPGQPETQRLLAIRSLGALGEPAALPFLIEWSQDQNGKIAEAATLAIERLLQKK